MHLTICRGSDSVAREGWTGVSTLPSELKQGGKFRGKNGALTLKPQNFLLPAGATEKEQKIPVFARFREFVFLSNFNLMVP